MHLLASCPFAMELWTLALQKWELPLQLSPMSTTKSLLDWWEESRSRVPAAHRRAWSSLVQLL